MTISEIQPLRNLIVVKRYVRPTETAAGIIIPTSWDTPMDTDLWEVMRGETTDYEGRTVLVGTGKDVAMTLNGFEVAADDILITFPFRGVHDPSLSFQFGYDVFFLDAAEVRAVRRWKDEA